MLKMIICMNEDKINLEKKYSLDGINQVLNDSFSKMGFMRIEEDGDCLVYSGSGNTRDYGRFGRIVNTLKKQSWFMENVKVWLFCDSDDSESPNDFNEEDLLNHYRQKQALGA